jgi:hypothetical protein
MSRCWTYQETVLSARCLFFTDAQVYYTCRQAAWAEAVSIPVERYGDQSADCSGTNLFLKPTHGRWRGFREDLFEYTGRNLGDQADALNALRGILSRYPYQSFWGIRIQMLSYRVEDHTSENMNAGFASGLSWEPGQTISPDPTTKIQWSRADLTRRKGFPSWSWAGWIGPVNYLTAGGGDGGKYYSVSRLPPYVEPKFPIDVWITHDDRTVISLYEHTVAHIDMRCLPEIGDVLRVTVTLVDLKMQKVGHGKYRVWPLDNRVIDDFPAWGKSRQSSLLQESLFRRSIS